MAGKRRNVVDTLVEQVLTANPEIDIYLVGGAVRDALLGRPVTDRDWVVVGARAEELLDAGFRPVGAAFPVFLHPRTQEEYALARTEQKTGSGHGGFDCRFDPSVTLEEDLSRRDLTINAIAQAPDGSLVDPYGGVTDLQHRVLRHVSEAFVEDPLRVLRVARFSASLSEFSFRVDPETQNLLVRMVASGELSLLPRERNWQEFMRALGTAGFLLFLDLLAEIGALPIVFAGLVWPAETANEARLRSFFAGDAFVQRSDVQRFAVLAASLQFHPELVREWKAPNEFVEASSVAGLLYDFAAWEDAPESLAMLERCDVLRRPERFYLVLEALVLISSELSRRDAALRTLVEQLRSVDAQVFTAAGLRGAEIGEAMRAQRLEYVAAAGLGSI